MKVFVLLAFIFTPINALACESIRDCVAPAEQGDARAQYLLGMLYATGDGVPQDYKEAAKWFHKAAEQGDVSAQSLLGTMYAHGNGVPQDYKEAVKWHRKAAEQGYARAQYFLGDLYATGKGVPQDDVMAYAWFNLATAQGDAEAKKARELVHSRMTTPQIAEAQKLSRQYWNKY